MFAMVHNLKVVEICLRPVPFDLKGIANEKQESLRNILVEVEKFSLANHASSVPTKPLVP